MSRHAKPGVVDQIWCRPARLVDPILVERAELTERGLAGDHARAGKRALTLIQAEHLPVIASLAGCSTIDPALLRRNLVISGLNLAACRGQTLTIGAAEVEVTVPCHPCSRMEAALGYGGYTALRGHSGWCARVITPAPIACGDAVTVRDGQTAKV